VITGGASGIGQATALLFAQEGARVALIDRDLAAAEAVAETILHIGGEAMAFGSDVGLPGTADADAAAILAKWGRIDSLVCSAGFSVGGTIFNTTPEDWNAVFQANVGGTWLWARAVIPAMQRQGGGSIVTFGSQLALAGGRGNPAYIAAKGAILSLTRNLALDYAPDHIRVNAIAPGAIDTPMLRRSFARKEDPAAARAASESRHAMGRLGLAEEVAQSALHLASSASTFTTGTTMVVDGGWLAA
jgi:NAD(P)-dependent dehydrogenase (short-subunit alcohol dehydrogenase family)